MNQLPIERRSAVIRCLVEGSSIRSTSRITGVSKTTILKLLCDLGAACQRYHDKYVRNVKATRVQADEIWSYVYGKDRNLPAFMRGQKDVGSLWTWTAIDADSKFMLAWHVGERDMPNAERFMQDLASRVSGRISLTTDAHAAYDKAVPGAFGWEIDYGQLTKQYEHQDVNEGRFRPCVGVTRTSLIGSPTHADLNTSTVERANLTMRMGMRRFTRKTNGFSKKGDNHRHAVAAHMFYQNFVRVHSTLRTTPAQAIGLTGHAWEIEEMARLVDL